MSESSSDGCGMFGDSSEGEVDKEEKERQEANSPPPDYVNGEEFQKF
jgi:hypothetical protein